MSKDKEKPVTLTTPKGIALFPYLNVADTKFDKDGVYKVTLKLASEESGGVIDQIEKVMEKAQAMAEEAAKAKRKKAKASDLPYSEELDESGEETGYILFRAKSKASGVNAKGTRWERKIPLFDPKGKPIKVTIKGGSVLKLSLTLIPWVNPKFEYGVKLQLEAVQVFKLGQGGGERSASGFGFEAEEDAEDLDLGDSAEDLEEDAEDEAEDEEATGPSEEDDF